MNTTEQARIDKASGHNEPSPMRSASAGTALYGSTSIALYVLLFCYESELCRLAETVNGGEKTLFFVPILIAFAFSLVHGRFTGHFWELVGLKARQ